MRVSFLPRQTPQVGHVNVCLLTACIRATWFRRLFSDFKTNPHMRHLRPGAGSEDDTRKIINHGQHVYNLMINVEQKHFLTECKALTNTAVFCWNGGWRMCRCRRCVSVHCKCKKISSIVIIHLYCSNLRQCEHLRLLFKTIVRLDLGHTAGSKITIWA